jgi:hypothetical protein
MLNDAKLRAARPRDKAYKLTDSNRLYLLVTPGGIKHWRWGYAFDGKQKTLVIGTYPLISLTEARLKRDEAKLQLAEGKDPVAMKKLHIEDNLTIARTTFELVARQWYANAKGQWASVHAGDVLRCLERDVFPAIGDLPISQIRAPDVLKLLTAIQDRGRSRRRSGRVRGSRRSSLCNRQGGCDD